MVHYLLIGTGKYPHEKLRETCKVHCPQVNHNNTPEGNTHRFHGWCSFYRTHKGAHKPDYCGTNGQAISDKVPKADK